MIRVQRLERLRDAVNRLGFATIKELADEIGSSEATVRRDIVILDANGSVKKVPGG